MSVAKLLEKCFPGEGLNKTYREEILRVCNEFLDSGLSDNKFLQEITSNSDGKFWSCISEALVFQRLKTKEFGARPTIGVGPDFLLKCGDLRIWVEVVSPQPSGIPREWLDCCTNGFGTVPHNEILLRWTSVIKEKTDKLIGNPDNTIKGYINSGVVLETDAYIIAVNGCQLRHGPFPALHGISQFPYAAESVFPIGPYKLKIEAKTQKIVGNGYHERYVIQKPNGALVPSYAFLDIRNKMISAIWAVDFNGGSVIGHSEPSAVIHNPNATNPLPLGYLHADEEFVATPCGDDEYEFKRIKNGNKSNA